MSKLLALDIGDEWTGIAITDALRMFARPCTTIKAANLQQELTSLIEEHELQEIIIGYPITMHGKQSKQTEKVITVKEQLTSWFPNIQFTLWDERLSSKRASILTPQKSIREKSEKIKEHARAAAFILDSYLQYLAFKKDDLEQS